MYTVALKGVSKSYGADKVLDDIYLDIEEGEIFVLLGANGSGKSTLLKIIAALLKPDSGEISLLSGEGRSEVLRSIGMMFDHTAHWDKLTGYENAWFFARHYGLSKEEASIRLEDLISWIDLGEKSRHAVAEYSYGMRRKLLLIEALVHNPKLLLMDEPSMGLDHSSRLALYSELKDRAGKGNTVVIATNDVYEAELVADRVALIRNGKIIASGTPKMLVDSLRALTRIDLTLADPIPVERIEEIEEVESLDAEDGGRKLKILSRSGQDALVPIVKKVNDLDGKISEISVRPPNLGDVFLKFTVEDQVDDA